MKILTNIIFFFLVVPISLYGQWIEQKTLTNKFFSSIHFPSNNIGYVVGGVTRNPFNSNLGGNIIFKTMDNGDNWIKIAENINPAFLTKTFFINDTVGFAVGENGTVLKTKNGGTNWEIKNLNSGDLYSLFFVNPNIGYVVGAEGAIFKTIDSGENWQSLNCKCNMAGRFFYDLHFVTPSIGYIAGGQPKIIIKTTDGGLNWSELKLPSISGSLYSVHFLNSDTGLVSGHSEIYKTIDGGNKWTEVQLGYSGVFSAMHFPSSSIGYIASKNAYGDILKTIDGGENWTLQFTTPNFNLADIFMLDNSIGFASGAGGHIVKTINGGITSIQEIEYKNAKINIYPNPFSAQAVLCSANAFHNATILVNNVFGVTIKQIENINGESFVLQRDNLPNGVYFIVVTQGNYERIVKKVIISE